MNTSTELVRYVQLERTAQIAQSRLERLADCARACRDASTGLIDRLSRVVRLTPQSR